MNEKFDPFVSEWASFVNNPNHNLIEKCLKLAQILEYPELDIYRVVDSPNSISKNNNATFYVVFSSDSQIPPQGKPFKHFKSILMK